MLYRSLVSAKAESTKAQVMKRIGRKLTILAIFFFPASSFAGESTSASIRNCTWCHGTSAQGYTIAPRLAGQRPRYIENQLRGYAAHLRDNPFSKQYMWNAAATLHPQTVRYLADYFSSLPPKAANNGNRGLVVAGRTIYVEGIPDANIVACLACHGPDAEGVREIPRLGGLSYSYLKARLEQWGEGYHSAIESPMPRIASKIGPNEIEALASYLSFVK